jgi:methylated-DNA-protein-cysteine methyltransferase-like protein
LTPDYERRAAERPGAERRAAERGAAERGAAERPGAERRAAERGAAERRAAEIRDRVRAVPEGFVRTYGDVSPGAPRMAGAVLAANEDQDLPWHRIVRADGSLAKGRRQRRLLAAEGVPFRGERVDLKIARVPW